MGFIETLNKYCKRKAIHKTKLYKMIEDEKSHLEKEGFQVKIKDEFDMFDLEIICLAFNNKHAIDDAYSLFLNQNYDVLPYLNYEEKRKMFNLDLEKVLEKLPHFVDQDTNITIYIPFLEAFVNAWYTQDYGIMMLKQHHDYVENYKSHVHSAIELYGNMVYSTDFSCLKIIYEDERHVCYYYDELYTVYIFKKENLEYLNEVTFVDSHFNGDVSDNEVKDIITLIEEYKYEECLEYLNNKGFISSKNYKKILKKYK